MPFAAIVRRFSVSPWPLPADWYALPLRAIVGFGFLEHGCAKLARGPDKFVAILHVIGTPFADILGPITIATELLGGLLVLVGAFLPLAAAPMMVVLLVATLTVHLKNGFSSIKLLTYDGSGPHFGQPGYETDLLYAACLLALCIRGAGSLSVDSLLAKRRARTVRRASAACPDPQMQSRME